MSTTRRQFNMAALGSAALLSNASARSASRPNIIFLLTDDQRWDQMGCAGHRYLKTPNMDRIAREGAMFTNMFVTTSLCSPSRACFLTGRYAHAHGVKDNEVDIAETEMQRAFPAVLRRGGYETAHIGKFHMGPGSAPRPGYDYWAAFPGLGVYLNPEVNVNGNLKQFEGHCGRVITDMALDWLKRPRQKPFCLTLGFKEPHHPFTPPEHLKDLYSDAKIALPPVTPDQMRGKPAEFRIPRKLVPERFAETQRNYWRCITAADEQIGRVLQYLDQNGLAENTIVAFAGDNGYCFGDFGLMEKRNGYEPSLRIPMLVRYPKLIKPGTRVASMALNIDLCPTLLDLAGQPIPKQVHGASWAPLFRSPSAKWRQSFQYEHWREGKFPIPTIKGIRTSRYKYLEYTDTQDAPELYDLKTDPAESNNLSDKTENRSLMARLKSEMLRIESQTR
jgi:arylsulfatase A-like enzyme